MNLSILKSKIIDCQPTIVITGSKSESNRLLMLKALYPQLNVKNLSNSDDTKVMSRALGSNDAIIDVHHAGTAMRFLTAYYAIQDRKEVIMTGSDRMKERPIKILVEALQQLGASISYEENHGFPPIKIIGKKLNRHRVSLPANVSSQYISALLLIAPKLNNGLEVILEGNITSAPYIKMTLALLKEMGVEASFEGHTICVKSSKAEILPKSMTVESDWSSASYWYSIVALSEIGTEVKLSSYKKNSLQADAILIDLYKNFGVETQFLNDIIRLKKSSTSMQEALAFNLQSSPDIAQTIAVTCFGLGLGCHLSGLHTLKIKETDRLEALKTELQKLGANISVTNESLTLDRSASINAEVTIATYQDHRMAMAFAPLALKTSLQIEDAEVVSKSYPRFWKDLKAIGFKITEY